MVGYLQTSERSSISSIVCRIKFFVKRARFCAGVDLGSWIVSITELNIFDGILLMTISTTDGLGQRITTGEVKLPTFRMRDMNFMVVGQIWEAIKAIVYH